MRYYEHITLLHRTRQSAARLEVNALQQFWLTRIAPLQDARVRTCSTYRSIDRITRVTQAAANSNVSCFRAQADKSLAGNTIARFPRTRQSREQVLQTFIQLVESPVRAYSFLNPYAYAKSVVGRRCCTVKGDRKPPVGSLR